MQPYEFGYAVGNHMAKQAAWGDYAQAAGDAVKATFDPSMYTLDPTQRGMGAEIALYSNPFTGVPTAVNDTARHLYNGRFMDAGMSALSGAMSFLPGWGFGAKFLTGAARAGAGAAAKAGLKTTGKVLGTAARFGDTGADVMRGANQVLSKGLQRTVPLNAGNTMAGRMANTAIKNPLSTVGTAAPFAVAAPQIAGAISAARSAPAEQPQYGSFASGQAGVAY